MSYTDMEMVIASELAYIDMENDGRTLGETIYGILNDFGTYDVNTGTYVMNPNLPKTKQAAFNHALSIVSYGEQGNVSWTQWKITDSCNRQGESGFYGCLIDKGGGEAIIACRGSESYDLAQTMRDWGKADFGRLNNALTEQQRDMTNYMEYLYKNGLVDQYDSLGMTGHSLGGSLATHGAISAPEGMQSKIESVISYDGPGFSDEYIRKYREGIERMRGKLTHYEYSFVGALLFQPPGTNNRVIKAHNDSDSGVFGEFVRHALYNIEFDENGNVMDGSRGMLQHILSFLSKDLEILLTFGCFGSIQIFIGIVSAAISGCLLSIGFQALEELAIWLKEHIDDAVQSIRENIKDMYETFMMWSVSGDYTISFGEVNQIGSSLDDIGRKLDQIAEQVRIVKRELPYESSSAFYYKAALERQAIGLAIEGNKVKRISQVLDKAVMKYNRGDQRVAESM